MDWEFRDVVTFVAATGGLEVAPFTLGETVHEISPVRRREVRTLAADHGIESTGLQWLLVKPEGLHLTRPDAAFSTSRPARS